MEPRHDQRGRGLLVAASCAGRFGRVLCEAAIQSVHVQRPITGRTDTAALLLLYHLLARHAPSLGVGVARAAVMLEGGDARGAMAALDALSEGPVHAYQPYWVTRARTLQALDDRAGAEAARQTAIGLTEDAGVRDFLRGSSADAAAAWGAVSAATVRAPQAGSAARASPRSRRKPAPGRAG